MAPKLPLPRGWKRRVIVHMLDQGRNLTCWNNGPFHGAPKPVHPSAPFWSLRNTMPPLVRQDAIQVCYSEPDNLFL